MNWLTALVEFLAKIFGPKPTPPPVNDPPVKPPPTKRITKDDDFRTLPTITKERFREITKGFPFEKESDAIWEAVKGRPLPLAQSWMESRYGQDPNAKATNNPLGLFWDATWAPGPHMDSPPLLRFSTWADAFKEWARRMDTPTYKNGVYPQGMTLEQMIFTYVGGPDCLSKGVCANGETPASCRHYLDETVDRLNRYYGFEDPKPADPPPSRIGNPYPLAGSNKTVILPFPLKQAIIPASQTNQRPGIRMSPDRYVQHDTGNRNVGADAENHKVYLEQGAPDNYGRSQQLSYHFTVDDKEAWQMIPVNEVSWHGGDGDGPCNMHGISCELCINADINEPESRRKAEILAAEVMNALALPLLEKHGDCCARQGNPAGCHSGCPADMINDGYWPTFVQHVKSLRASRK